MSLITLIDTDIKTALLSRDQASLRALRAVKTALLLARTEKGAAEETSPDTELKILQKQIKQRKESAEIYHAQNRADLATIEEEELEVIEKYVPKQLNSAEIEIELSRLIYESGAISIKDLGKLMTLATSHFAGKAENKIIAELAKKMLSQK